MKKNKAFSIMLLFAVTLFMTCSENPSEPTVEAPSIPPHSTFVMDFDDFSSTSLSKTAAKSNWLWAASNVAVWNTVIVVTLAVPVAAFAESFNHDPVFQTDGSWLWSYTFQVLGLSYTAKLYGALQVDGVKWDMYISQQGLYTDFHWFSGKSDLLLTSGYWELNHQPSDPKPFLNIDWHRSNTDLSGDIKYTNIIPDSDENGGYIFQAFNQPAPFTGMYDIYAASSQNLTQIKWDYETAAGRVSDPKHFGDDLWHCWDENLDDAECQ
jgi:hypothetical protein